VNFGDINIYNNTFLKLLFVGEKLQNSFTADAENVKHLLEDKHPPF
jgi:hypothetical protein